MFSTDSPPATTINEGHRSRPTRRCSPRADPARVPARRGRHWDRPGRGRRRRVCTSRDGSLVIRAVGGSRWSRDPVGRRRLGPPHRPPRRWLTARPRRPRPHPPPPVDHDANAMAVVERFLGGEGASLPGRATSRSSPGSRATQGLRADHRGDRAPDRRHEGPGRCARLQRHLAGAAADRHRGRQGPRDLHEQPGRVAPASTSTARSCPTPWTACRT